jgi:hypothetical protein
MAKKTISESNAVPKNSSSYRSFFNFFAGKFAGALLRVCLKSHFFLAEAPVLKRRGLSKPHPDRGLPDCAFGGSCSLIF